MTSTPEDGPLYPLAAALAHSVADDAVSSLRAITDPAYRARAAGEAVDAATDLRSQLAAVRREAVRELRGPGRPPLRTWEQVGDELGVTGARAHQLADLPADPKAPRGPR